ncbi:hypothetical protein [[Eubacterium] cellulosolvens]
MVDQTFSILIRFLQIIIFPGFLFILSLASARDSPILEDPESSSHLLTFKLSCAN